MRKIDAICRHLTKTLFVETFMMDESIKKHTLVENFCMISGKTMVRVGSSLIGVIKSC